MVPENQLIPVSYSSQIVNESGMVESNCNAITFINTGTDTVNILGYPLLQGYQLYLPCNVGEIDRTNYTATFEGAFGTIKSLLVIRKIY